MAKERPDPITQGCITEIYRLFFAPLIKYKPEEESLREWMETLFHYRYRDIYRYQADRRFTIPGILYVAGNVRVQGIGHREVKRGSILWVRHDVRSPDQYDVEFLGGPGNKAQVFSLNESEWGFVKLHLSEVEKKRDATRYTLSLARNQKLKDRAEE